MLQNFKQEPQEPIQCGCCAGSGGLEQAVCHFACAATVHRIVFVFISLTGAVSSASSALHPSIRTSGKEARSPENKVYSERT